MAGDETAIVAGAQQPMGNIAGQTISSTLFCVYAARGKSQGKFFTWKGRSQRALVVQVAQKGDGKAMLARNIQPIAKTLDGLPRTAACDDLRGERWLVARAKSGREDAFGELYERHRPKAYRAAHRILHNRQDAEDAVQRAFQRALVNLERFREDSTFLTWLTRISINEALMLLRQRRTAEPPYENGVDGAQGHGGVEIADGKPTPEEILCEGEQRAALRQAITRLRKKLRIIVFYRELRGLTCAETARRLGLTVSTVKTRTFRARRALRKLLERSGSRAARQASCNG